MAHEDARRDLNLDIKVEDTHYVLKKLSKLSLGPCKVDIGKMALLYREEVRKKPEINIKYFLQKYLEPVLDKIFPLLDEPRDIVLFGFGRVGRLIARILIEKAGGGDKMNLRAIVVRPGKATPKLQLYKRATLLMRDSVHGPFKGIVEVIEEKNAIVANGNYIQFITSDSPEEIDYTEYGIKNAILVDNTGIFRDEKNLKKHLNVKGISKVVLTAPGKGVPNIVAGVNDHLVSDEINIFAAASCTTNAIVPILKVLYDKFGIEKCHVETVHSYTNDQNLIDNYHDKSRRGRSAVLNMVITETGAAEAVSEALPDLSGKVTGNAIRVPTSNVSLAIIILTLSTPTTKENLNEYLRYMALYSNYQRQVGFSLSEELVSSDIIGNRHAGVVDAPSTIVTDNQVIVYVWYDNEFGYSAQVVRLLQRIAGVNHPTFPQDIKSQEEEKQLEEEQNEDLTKQENDNN